MFLRHSLELPEDHVITKEAEASVMLTASVSSASVVSGLEIRVWWHHILEYISVYSTFSCGTLDLLQRSESEICSAYFSCPVFSRGRAVILHQIGTCFPGFLCCSFHLYLMEHSAGSNSHGQQTQEEVHSGGKEVRGDYKYISMFISVRRFSTRGHMGQGEPGLIAHKENDRKQKKNLMWDWQWKGRSTGWWEERRGVNTPQRWWKQVRNFQERA